jgi:hypothetical protein
MSDLETKKTLQRTVIIPESIEYPQPRIAFDAGLLKKGSRVRVRVIVDEGGVVVKDELSVTLFKEFPTDKDVLGVVKVNFVETDKVNGVK